MEASWGRCILIPVLVSCVESNRAPTASDAALSIIRDEHRSLAAVVHGLEYVVREAREQRNTRVDAACCAAIVHYVRAFPEALHHHSKEDTYLFPLAGARARTNPITTMPSRRSTRSTPTWDGAHRRAGPMLGSGLRRGPVAGSARPCAGGGTVRDRADGPT